MFSWNYIREHAFCYPGLIVSSSYGGTNEVCVLRKVCLAACFLYGVSAVSPAKAQDIYDGRAHGAVTVSPDGYKYASTSSSSLPQKYPPPPSAYINYRPPYYGSARPAAAPATYTGAGYAATPSASLSQSYPPPPSAYVGYGSSTYNVLPQPYIQPIPEPRHASTPVVSGEIPQLVLEPVPASKAVGMGAVEKDRPGNLYYTFDIIGGVSFARDHELIGSTGRDDVLEVRHEDDLVLGNSLAVGYNWKDYGFPIRGELEAGIRYRFDLDYRAKSATNSSLIAGYATNLATLFAMTNAYYDFDLDSKFWPYVGAGIGWARHRADTERRDPPTDSTVSEINNTDNFTWSVMAGTIYNWTPHWGVGLEGRFTDLGEVNVGPFGSGDKIESNYYSFDVAIGITYTP